MSLAANNDPMIGRSFSFLRRVDAHLLQEFKYTMTDTIAKGGEATVYRYVESPIIILFFPLLWS
jgi:hypothetical protein